MITKNITLRLSILFSFLTVFAGRVFGVIFDFLVIRLFGADKSGADAFFLSMGGLKLLRTAFSEGFLSSCALPSLSKLFNHGEQDRAARLSTLLLLFFSTIIGLLAIAAFYSPSIVVNVFLPRANPRLLSTIYNYFPVFKLVLLFFIAAQVLFITLRANKRTFVPVFEYGFSYIIMLISLYFFASYKVDLSNLGFTMVTAEAGCFIIAVILALSNGVLPKNPFFKETFLDALEIAKKYLPLALGYFSTYLFFGTQSVVSQHFNPGEIALLHFVYKIYHMPLYAFNMTINQILLPSFSQSTGDAPSKKLRFLFFNGVKAILIAVPAIILFSFYFSANTFAFFLNKDTADQDVITCMKLFTALTLSLLFTSLTYLNNALCYSLRNTNIPAFATSATSAIKILLMIPLVSYMGIFGVIAADLVASFVTCMFTYIKIYTKFGITIPAKKTVVFISKVLLKIALVIGLSSFIGTELAARGIANSDILIKTTLFAILFLIFKYKLNMKGYFI